MKYAFLFVCLLFFIEKSIAQDTIPAKNNSLITLKMEADNRLFRYNGILVKEKKAYAILHATNDQEIMDLTSRAKKQKKFITAGFVTIPLVFSSAFLYFNAIQTHGPGLSERARKRDKHLAACCAVLAVTFSMQAIYANSKRNQLHVEAVRIYNEKY